jgi:hypothetical protein
MVIAGTLIRESAADPAVGGVTVPDTIRTLRKR